MFSTRRKLESSILELLHAQFVLRYESDHSQSNLPMGYRGVDAGVKTFPAVICSCSQLTKLALTPNSNTWQARCDVRVESHASRKALTDLDPANAHAERCDSIFDVILEMDDAGQGYTLPARLTALELGIVCADNSFLDVTSNGGQGEETFIDELTFTLILYPKTVT